jgi:predicted DNA-binding protein YlxM (UPF0122 family)
MKDDLQFLRLFDLYAPLLTATQREITELYFNFDLSLGEIAEQKGVSRQSVSDCLAKSRKQLQGYEEKLNFCKALDDVSREYSAYMTTVERWIGEQGTKEANALRQRLDEVHRDFGVERIELEEGAVIGKPLQEEE